MFPSCGRNVSGTNMCVLSYSVVSDSLGPHGRLLRSMGFSRHEHWRGRLCPPPGGLPSPAVKPASLTSLAFAGGFFATSTTWNM